MAYKTTRKKTGVNSYEKRTYNTKTGSTRITRTVKPTKSLTISPEQVTEHLAGMQEHPNPITGLTRSQTGMLGSSAEAGQRKQKRGSRQNIQFSRQWNWSDRYLEPSQRICTFKSGSFAGHNGNRKTRFFCEK